MPKVSDFAGSKASVIAQPSFSLRQCVGFYSKHVSDRMDPTSLSACISTLRAGMLATQFGEAHDVVGRDQWTTLATSPNLMHAVINVRRHHPKTNASDIELLHRDYLDLLTDARVAGWLTDVQVDYLMTGDKGRVKRAAGIGKVNGARQGLPCRSSIKSFVGAAVSHGALNTPNSIRLARLLDEVASDRSEIGLLVCGAIGDKGNRMAKTARKPSAHEQEKQMRRRNTLWAFRARGLGCHGDSLPKSTGVNRRPSALAAEVIASQDKEDDRRSNERLAALGVRFKRGGARSTSLSCQTGTPVHDSKSDCAGERVESGRPATCPAAAAVHFAMPEDAVDVASTLPQRERVRALSSTMSEKMSFTELGTCLSALAKTFPWHLDDPDRDAWCDVVSSVGLMRSVATMPTRYPGLKKDDDARKWFDEAALIYLSQIARACKEGLISSGQLRNLLLGHHGRTPLTIKPVSSGETVKSFVRSVTASDALSTANLNALATVLALLVDLESIDANPPWQSAEWDGVRKAMTARQAGKTLPASDAAMAQTVRHLMGARVDCERSLGPGVARGYGSHSREGLISSLERAPVVSKQADFYLRLKEYGFVEGVKASRSAEFSSDTGLIEFGKGTLVEQRMIRRCEHSMWLATLESRTVEQREAARLAGISAAPSQDLAPDNPVNGSGPTDSAVPLTREPSRSDRVDRVDSTPPLSWAGRVLAAVKSKIARLVRRIGLFFRRR